MFRIPYFQCDNEEINKAYRYAIACVASNVVTMQAGILKESKPCIMAGNHYTTPWTRDAAINVYNAIALLSPEIATNTLYSVVQNIDGKTVVGDQYWDKIIWAIGAYKLYLIQKDTEFLRFAFETLKNTISELEKDEFDGEVGLFRGGAVYGDGVSAYPEPYRNPDGSAGILDWAEKNPDKKYPMGHGVPMETLSTNCVYAEAYRIMAEMAKLCGENETEYTKKAVQMRANINRLFWNKNKGSYDYLQGESDAQEGLGLAYAILFGIADENKIQEVIKNVYLTKQGIPCVYPVFKPYEQYGYGRHCGTVWPHIQGFWAKAMLQSGVKEYFDYELFALTKNAVRDKQFAEIYHPETGELYGGVQEWNGQYVEWKSEDYQTWSATAYLNMILEGIVGLSVADGVRFTPYLPKGINRAELKNLWIKGQRIDVEIIRRDYTNKENKNIKVGEKYTIYVD